MARALTHSLPSNTLSAAVRRHFGLTQTELGRYLGVSDSQIGHLEAGRRQLPALVNLRLTRLALLLPPPEGYGLAATATAFAVPAVPAVLWPPELPLPGPLAAGPLQKRQRRCTRRLALLRRDWHQLAARAAGEGRRRWALGVLATALSASPADLSAADPAEAAHLQRWLEELAATLPAAPARRPDTATALALLLLRLALLEVEEAALARLLAPAS